MATALLERNQKTEVYYPESDGKPMAETEFHLDEAVKVRGMLKHHLRSRSDVYIGANMLFYYQEGNPRKSVAPDIFVVYGVPKRKRRIYKLWEEGVVPSIVFEFTSKSTAGEDLHAKRNLYERLGVPEYILIDVLGEYLPSPLAAYRLVEGRYAPVSVVQKEGEWRMHSETLDLDIVVQHTEEGYTARLFDPVRNEWLLNPEEAARKVEVLEDDNAQLQQALTTEQRERERLTRQLKQLQAELDKLRKKS
jgi:Uma2 family endonuclease